MKIRLFNKKNTVIIIILFVFIVSFSLFLQSSPGIEEYETLPTISEYNEIYSEIIERNRKMLENPVEYGDKYCSGYISTKKDLQVHETLLNKLQLLSDNICSNAKNDYEKTEAIAYYVAENIYYNYVAANDSVTAEIISLEYVLDSKIATCAGYSNLFSALCNMQGIYCVNLRGGTYDKSSTAENLMSVPTNHEWNAVMIDGEWFFIDTTWLSNNNYTENGYEKAENFDDQYLIMSLEEMSYEHRIDIIDYRNFKTSINALK